HCLCSAEAGLLQAAGACVGTARDREQILHASVRRAEVNTSILIEVKRESRLHRWSGWRDEVRHRIFRRYAGADEGGLWIVCGPRAAHCGLGMAGTAAVGVEARAEPVVRTSGNRFDGLESSLSVRKQ